MFAIGNSQVDSIRLLYLEARNEVLHQMAQQRKYIDPDIVHYLRCQTELVTILSDGEPYKARYLGFVVTFGVIRTLAATMLTLAVALWSVARGIGIFVTIESFCPIR
jgi:hypothetical protein